MKTLALLCTVALSLPACVTNRNKESTTKDDGKPGATGTAVVPSLVGTTWHEEGQAGYFSITSDGEMQTVAGNDGCNSFSGGENVFGPNGTIGADISFDSGEEECEPEGNGRVIPSASRWSSYEFSPTELKVRLKTGELIKFVPFVRPNTDM